MAFARFAAEVFAAAHFLDDEFFALFGAEDFGGYARAFEERRPELSVAAAADGEDGIEAELLAGGDVAIGDDDFLALFDFVLAAAVGDDCVHGDTCSLICLLKSALRR